IFSLFLFVFSSFLYYRSLYSVTRPFYALLSLFSVPPLKTDVKYLTFEGREKERRERLLISARFANIFDYFMFLLYRLVEIEQKHKIIKNITEILFYYFFRD